MREKDNLDFRVNGNLVAPEEIESLAADLIQYDREHSEGTWGGRGLAAMVMQHFEDDEGMEKLQKDVESNLTIEEISKRHEAALLKVGLELESPNKEGNIDENEIYAVGSLEAHIGDKEKFISFLKSIDANKITGAEKRLLTMVSQKLSREVMEVYKLDEADNRLLDLISGLKDIIGEYERLGLADHVSTFKDYLAHVKSGYLKEYIAARRNKIFDPIGIGFNLSTYQIDMTGDHYVRAWDQQVFELLDDLKGKPYAKELYNDVFEYANNCLRYALNDSSVLKYDENYKRSIKEAMTEVRKKLATYERLL